MDWSSVKKPTLFLDKEICLKNIERMNKKAEAANVCFRPHFKTHQSLAVGKWFRNCGVNAITVSSVKMTEYFAEEGWPDITIAFPFNPLEWKEIKKLSEKCKINILASSLESAKIISAKADSSISVFIEIDAGYHRSGIDSSQLGEIIKTAQVLLDNNNVQLEGILSHFGNSYSEPLEKIQKLWDNSFASLHNVKEALAHFGKIKISVGDTPCCSIVNNFSGVDEIRPGNFVFYDVMQASKGICNFSDIAVAVACPVVDIHPERCEFVIYGGAVHLSKEFISEANGDRNYGLICIPSSNNWSLPVPGAIVKSLSQEHGIAKAPIDFIQTLNVGDIVFVLPIHSCLTAQCFNSYFDLEGNVLDHM